MLALEPHHPRKQSKCVDRLACQSYTRLSGVYTRALRDRPVVVVVLYSALKPQSLDRRGTAAKTDENSPLLAFTAYRFFSTLVFATVAINVGVSLYRDAHS